jgi:hypothetical protein
VTLATFGAGTLPLQPAKVTLAGQVMEGGVVSTVLVYVWETGSYISASIHCLGMFLHGHFGAACHVDDIANKSNSSIFRNHQLTRH